MRASAVWLAAALLAHPLAASDPADAVRKVILRAVESHQIPGAVVVVRQDGRNVVEEAGGYAVIEEQRPMRLDDIFMIASSTKPFTATTVLTLVDRNQLSLDDRVSKYYPAFKGRSTIRQLLSHTSGLFGNDAPPEVVEAIRNFDRPLAEAVPLILRAPLAYTPGTKFSYGGASFCVAAGIVEKLTGKEFDAYMGEALFEPLGMRDSFFRSKADISGRVPQMYERSDEGFSPKPAVMELPGRRGPRPDGFILAAGGLYTSARDAVRFLEMHLNGGAWRERRILSERLVEEMQKRQAGAAGEEYGLGWRRMSLDDGGEPLVVGHGGAYGTQLIVDRKRRLVAAIFTQMPAAQARDFLSQVQQTIATAF